MSDGKHLDLELTSTLSRICPTDWVRLFLSDGEVILATKLTFLQSDALIAFHMMRSNRPDKYEKVDEQLGLTANTHDLVRIELVEPV